MLLRATGAKGEIIVPTNTFVATIYAILRAGCHPVFADINNGLYVDTSSVKTAINAKTTGIMVVHIGGHVSDEIVALRELSDERSLLLFEDAAHSLGTKYDGTFTCNFGVGGACSFFPTKVAGSAEGGFIATNDDSVAAKARLMRDQGKQKGNYCTLQGYNWRMNEIQAVIALSQLRRLERFIEHREKIAKRYNEVFENSAVNEAFEKMRVSERSRPNWYKYVVFLKRDSRETIKQRLLQRGVTLSGEVYEVPCHLQPAFVDLGYKPGLFPNAERLCECHICLPVSANMTEEQIELVASSLVESAI